MSDLRKKTVDLMHKLITGPISKVQDMIEYSPIHVFFIFPLPVLYFLLARQLLGLHMIFVALLIMELLVLRYSVTVIAFIFFLLGVVFYVIGSDVEANYYISFVYGFFVLSILKYTYIIFADSFSKKKK